MATVTITKDYIPRHLRPTMATLQQGQLGIITGKPDTIHQGKLIMRLMSRVVELEAPYHAFSGGGVLAEIEVRILPAGAEVTLTQEKE